MPPKFVRESDNRENIRLKIFFKAPGLGHPLGH